MEWFTFERKRYGTMHRTTGSGHIFLEGFRKGTFFRTSCAEPYDAVKGLCKELSCKQCLQKSANILTARLQAQTRIVTGFSQKSHCFLR